MTISDHVKFHKRGTPINLVICTGGGIAKPKYLDMGTDHLIEEKYQKKLDTTMRNIF